MASGRLVRHSNGCCSILVLLMLSSADNCLGECGRVTRLADLFSPLSGGDSPVGLSNERRFPSAGLAVKPIVGRPVSVAGTGHPLQTILVLLSAAQRINGPGCGRDCRLSTQRFGPEFCVRYLCRRSGRSSLAEQVCLDAQITRTQAPPSNTPSASLRCRVEMARRFSDGAFLQVGIDSFRGVARSYATGDLCEGAKAGPSGCVPWRHSIGESWWRRDRRVSLPSHSAFCEHDDTIRLFERERAALPWV